MKTSVQVKVNNSEFSANHEEKLSDVMEKVKDVVPKGSNIDGFIEKSSGAYEGRIHVKSKIGSFVAKARSKNLFVLIAKIQDKLLRQMVNWREKRASKKRYHRRRQAYSLPQS